MLGGVMLCPLYPPVHFEYFGFSALSLGIGQVCLLVRLAGAVSGISKLNISGAHN
jgi:hypothetical protein